MDDYINKKYIEVKNELIKKAINGESTFYSELMEKFHISRRWIGKILFRVADSCHSNHEPILSSLVERKGGNIGTGYSYVVLNYGADKDFRREQIKCFNYWKNKNNNTPLKYAVLIKNKQN